MPWILWERNNLRSAGKSSGGISELIIESICSWTFNFPSLPVISYMKMQCLRGSSLLWKSNIRTSATFSTKSIFWTTTFIICFIFILKTRDTILRWFCGGCSSLSYRLISGHFLIHIIILKNRVKFQIFVDIVKIYSSFCIYICQFRFTLNSKCSPFLPWQNSTSSSKAAEPARPYINDGSSEAQKMSWFLLWNASHLFCNWGTDLLVAV